ncbi:MAG: hypothetical protein LBI54_02045, partial [Lachnospiraceae bacterium]|nr:hypothetical protein [Lachnospiraceae bacterium]
VNEAATVLVTATYEDGATRYAATATIELLPAEKVSQDDLLVKVLENNVTVNRAKTGGTLVPLLVTAPRQTQTGAAPPFGLESSIQAAPPHSAGSLVIKGVELRAPNGEILTTYSAQMCPYDDRYIEIKALTGAVNVKNIAVRVQSQATDAWLEAGAVNLSVVEKYPQITMTVGALNAFYTEATAQVTARAADGSTVKVTEIKPANDKARELVSIGNDGTLTALKAGSAALDVTLELEGYISPYKNKNTARVTARVSDAAPKIKLSAKAVSVFDSPGHSAGVQLLAADTKTPFESGYTVTGVAKSETNAKGNPVNNANVRVAYSAGTVRIYPNAGARTGNVLLKVSFAESSKPLYFTLKVNVVAASKLTASVKTKAVTIGQGQNEGLICEIPISLNAANLVISDWSVRSGNYADTPLAEAIGIAFLANRLALSVKDKDALSALIVNNKDAKHTLRFGSDALDELAGKKLTFAVTLNIVRRAPSFTVSTKGSLNIANPQSAVTATIKLAGVSSPIKDVTLRTAPDPLGSVSSDFYVSGIDGNTFQIKAAPGAAVVPKVRQNLSVTVELANGQVFNSWDSGSDKPLRLTPTQTASKAARSKSAVTLYTDTPEQGEEITLSLTTPANVKLGDVVIDQKSLDALNLAAGGFRLERSGANAWVIKLDGPPQPLGRAKSSYNIKLALWAAGTYIANPDGSFKAALTDAGGAARSKPALVTLRVNVK